MLLRPRHLLARLQEGSGDVVQSCLAEHAGKNATDLGGLVDPRRRRATKRPDGVVAAGDGSGVAAPGCGHGRAAAKGRASANADREDRGAADAGACGGDRVGGRRAPGRACSSSGASSSRSPSSSAAAVAAATAPPASLGRSPRSTNPAAPALAGSADAGEIVPKIEIDSKEDWKYLKENLRHAVHKRARWHVRKVHPAGVRRGKRKRQKGSEADPDDEDVVAGEGGGGRGEEEGEEEHLSKHVREARSTTLTDILPVLDKWVDDTFDCVGHGVLINGLPYEREAAEGDEGVEQPDDELHQKVQVAERTCRKLEKRAVKLRTTYPDLVLQVAEAHLRIATGLQEGGKTKNLDETSDMEVDAVEDTEPAAPEVLGGVADAAESYRKSLESIQRLGKNLGRITAKLARAEEVLHDELTNLCEGSFETIPRENSRPMIRL